MISVARLSLCTTCVVNKVFFCDLPHWQPHHNQPAKRKNTNIGNVNNTDCGSWMFAFEWNSHIEWYRDRGNPAFQNTMQLSVERPQSELWIIIIITELVRFHYGQRMGAFINTKLYQRMASVHNWLTELSNWLDELEMKGLFENFSSTESENSFFTRSHHVVEEISSCENFSHSRPSCGTLRNSISRTTGVMFIIFEAHQLVLWHIMGTNICWLGHRCLKKRVVCWFSSFRRTFHLLSSIVRDT